ncbi:MAG: hypothetical protein COV45_01640 [Deltaproteobacteria bacterium CG11_big_fil_rev_8_21_14_0_20_47_16]|nr:MAG: hypothetical protein COV45_01640 [Deltaproteobacteria bacterium CG11_big_fil_rev_8_21_14_0_20_47_16]
MIVVAIITAFAASLLTFFSGFGLGTILMPVMAIFFPVEVAIALTAIVHFLNNLFKLILIGRHARWMVVFRFGIPAMLAAYLGAKLLFDLPHIKQVVAVLMIIFVLLELLPQFKKVTLGLKWMPLGGLLSGFFGGLSGHQGALRSMFLIRAGLSKEMFIATGVVIACVIDVTRLSVYTAQFSHDGLYREWPLIASATVSAFVGSYVGSRLLKKVTISTLQVGVAIAIMIFAILLALNVV